MSEMVEKAVAELRRRGHDVEPADIPGLWHVSGYPELTERQLIDVAWRTRSDAAIK